MTGAQQIPQYSRFLTDQVARSADKTNPLPHLSMSLQRQLLPECRPLLPNHAMLVRSRFEPATVSCTR